MGILIPAFGTPHDHQEGYHIITSINPTHVVTKKGIPLWVIIPWSIHFWADITEHAPTIPIHGHREHLKKIIYVKNGYLATLL